jgi:hypothetical protein
MNKINSSFQFFICIFSLIFFGVATDKSYSQNKNPLEFKISFSSKVHSKKITGRAYIIVTKDSSRAPRFQRFPNNSLMWGKDIFSLSPGTKVVVDESVFGFPINSIKDIPAGEYYVQGFINIYTEFKRSDGFTLWMHNDQWEGQRWNRSPGNLYSEPQKIQIDHSITNSVRLVCDKKIPPLKIHPDTKWVKRIKFKSEKLSKFWGQPIYLGATILLPKHYDQHPDAYYPVNYLQGHFSLRAPYGFREEDSNSQGTRRKRSISDFWKSDSCPRMIAVTFQHPCPYYDDSYAVNSPNVGPYQDAIMQELIPKVEEQFRIIRKPYARILSGGSTGGWISLMLQIFQPDFFGGVFSMCPDPVDFRYFQCVNIYEDKNAYFKEFGWIKVPTASDRYTDGIVRFTSKQRNHMELVLGTKNRSGDQIDIFEAAYGPIGEDGYVKPLFDKLTGEIDSTVANYWKNHYDLRYYLEKNWSWLGPKLVNKLHIYTGDMDTFYLNNAVNLLEEFLKNTRNPYYAGLVEYGDGKPHCWGPGRTELFKIMADYITKNEPKGEATSKWKYK